MVTTHQASTTVVNHVKERRLFVILHRIERLRNRVIISSVHEKLSIQKSSILPSKMNKLVLGACL